MSTQMELDSNSITLEQITNQMLVHQNELRQLERGEGGDATTVGKPHVGTHTTTCIYT
ncbi:hypothetical protein E4U58_006568 [Claviceps cyperi]|nr:hypothetical protein E4U58_006568 [Claviceps cyperi]